MTAPGLAWLAGIVVGFAVIPGLFLYFIDRLCRKDERP